MKKYYLPNKTATALEWHEQSQRPRNIGLLLDKYVPAAAINAEEAEDKRKDERTNWLRKMERVYQNDGKLAQAAYHRWRSYTSAQHASHFSAKIDWHLIVGLGGNSVLETDLTLHHLYGLPIIPGSALKGLTRTYAAMEDKGMYITDSDGQLKPSTEIKTDHDDIQRIFGMTDREGTVIFFDAFPEDGQATLVLDIMNPHYPDYYQGHAAPTNDQNPRPIAFLAVQDTTYMFALALRQGVPEEHRVDLATAKTWLGKALADYGVGGKTSAGYGYFQQASGVDVVDLMALRSEPVRASQASQTSSVSASAPQQNWQRPNIPQFQVDAQIQNCVVIEPNEVMRQGYPKAQAFLRYRELSPKYAYIVIDEAFPEAQSWRPKESKSCILIREEQHEGSLVLICKPKAK